MHKMLATAAHTDSLAKSGPPNAEVFRTNVASRRQAVAVVELVRTHFAGYRVTLDLDDCDRVLRVQDCYSARPLPTAAIRQLVRALGFEIEELAE